MRNSYWVGKERFSEAEILTGKWENSQAKYLLDAFHFIQEWHNKDSVIHAQTSGSTGEPKKMDLLKKDLINSAKATGMFFSFEEGHSHFSPLPASFIAGKMMIVRSMVWNTTLHLFPPSSNPLEYCTSNFDFGVMTPHQLQVGLHSQYRENIRNIKTLLLGGSPVSKDLEIQLQELDTEIHLGFGMTETMSHIALRKLNGSDKSQIYKAVDGVEFSLDKRDCLEIHATHLSFGSLQTNDIVRLIDSHSFEWLGRYDFVINSGGIKLFPEQMEKKLQGIIPRTFYITSEVHEILGEQVILRIEGDEIKDIESMIKPHLSKYELPKKIYFDSSFTYTKTGKIIRK